MVCKAKHCRKVKVSAYCRRRPAMRGMGPVAQEQQRVAAVAGNYRKREAGAWHKGVNHDLIDRKAMTDSTLTRSENRRLLDDLWKNFR